MLSLNTLRTKFGIVLSVVIALALLAFIFSLRYEMGFGGNDPKVGEINGDKILYSEYYNEYEVTKNNNGGAEAYDEAADERFSSSAWQSLIAKHALIPGFQKMGVAVSEAERLSMLSGEHTSSVFFSAFGNPMTGEYDVKALSEFLAQSEGNLQMQQLWNYINSQALLERQIAKYSGLVKGGAYVNALEVADGVRNANNTFAGKVVSRRYTSLPDSIFSVSKSEIKKYYNEHKNMYEQQPSRTMSYVLFEVEATPEDMTAIENEVKGVAAEFAVADDVKAFVRQNRHGSIDDRYVSKDELSSAESAALMAGKTYGPELANDVWTVARVLDSKIVADSLKLSHIVVSYNENKLADSLYQVVKGGANFAEVARNHSMVETATAGGEIGTLPFSALPAEFVAPLENARKGDIVKIVSGNAIQIVKVDGVKGRSKHVKVARLEYPVVASSATTRNVHNSASSFAVAANGSVDKFNAAATEASVTPRVVDVMSGERTVRGLEHSQEVVRWAYNAEVGDVSEIFKVDGDYVVAVLTGIDNEEFKPLSEVESQIKNAIMRDKKYAHIVSEMSGATIDEVAASFGEEVTDFDGVTFGSYYINGVGVEPRLVGAIAATAEKDVVSAPVKGNMGVYVYVVTDIANAESQSAEAEKVRLQAMAEGMAPQTAFFAVQRMANVVDLRSKYF
ncbi:MAG: SurA N-terminal domain-containing protein [Alistipes sp.]|nr:SurA N-terminal domain-containing protein [Alistipes sp.]